MTIPADRPDQAPIASHESLARERARFALERLQHAGEGAIGKRAIQELPGLPILLRTLGVLQACALLAANPLADALGVWLLERCPAKTLVRTGESGRRGLIAAVIRAEPAALRAAEREAIELAVTMKLLAEALDG